MRICLMMHRLASFFKCFLVPVLKALRVSMHPSIYCKCCGELQMLTYASIHVLAILSAYRLSSLSQMLFCPRSVSASCIYASIYALGVLSAYRLASLFQMLLSPSGVSVGVSVACIYACIYILGVLFTYQLFLNAV